MVIETVIVIADGRWLELIRMIKSDQQKKTPIEMSDFVPDLFIFAFHGNPSLKGLP